MAKRLDRVWVRGGAGHVGGGVGERVGSRGHQKQLFQRTFLQEVREDQTRGNKMNSESMPGPHDQGWVAQGLLRSEGRGKGTGSQLFRPKSLPPGSLPRPPVVSDSPPPLLTPVQCSISCRKLLEP